MELRGRSAAGGTQLCGIRRTTHDAALPENGRSAHRAASPWTEKLWVYDLRTNKHFTQKQSPITRGDFDEFVACYRPGAIHKRKPTWTEEKPDGRWRCFGYDELIKRDKLSLDLFWIKDQSLTDTDSLPAPDILAIEIADELQTVVDLFSRIAAKLPKSQA